MLPAVPYRSYQILSENFVWRYANGYFTAYFRTLILSCVEKNKIIDLLDANPIYLI